MSINQTVFNDKLILKVFNVFNDEFINLRKYPKMTKKNAK